MNVESRPRKGNVRILALVTDAHGGFGGISQYNRDALEAIAAWDDVDSVHVIPRLLPEKLGPVPHRLQYDLNGLGGRARFVWAAVRRSLLSGPLDLIYCAHINLMPSALLASAISRAPIVLAIYGIDVWSHQGRLARWLASRHASSVISISSVTAERFNRWCPFPREKLHIVPNAIRLNDYGPAPRNATCSAKYGLEDRKVLLTFGRMVGRSRAKGFDEVIEILPRLALQVPNIVYVCAGDGPDRARLEAKAQSLGISARVIFTGRIEEATKADLFRSADLYVMPSRGEGFGFVVLEALASGVPVVASEADGTREAVLDGKLGLLVDPDDPDSILDGILEGLKQSRGIKPGVEFFSFDRFAERLRAALATVCPL